VVLYGCETFSPTLKKHRLRVFANMVLRGIFVPRGLRVTTYWRKLHNEELHKMYSSPSRIIMIKTRKIGWTRHLARRMGIGY
jgi:hypothetical protein